VRLCIVEQSKTSGCLVFIEILFEIVVDLKIIDGTGIE
jgi:hypothetical protein